MSDPESKINKNAKTRLNYSEFKPGGQVFYGSRLFLKFFLWFLATVFLTTVIVGFYAYYFHIKPEMKFFDNLHLENLRENATYLVNIYENGKDEDLLPYSTKGVFWLYDQNLKNLLAHEDYKLKKRKIPGKKNFTERFLKDFEEENKSFLVDGSKDERLLAEKAASLLGQKRVSEFQVGRFCFQACKVESASGNTYVAVRYLFWKDRKRHLYLFEQVLKAIPIFILVSIPICFALSRYMAKPVIQISTASKKFAAGDLDARVVQGAARRYDELGDLARDFNYMAEKLATFIKSQNKLMGDISHELRSPLARLQVACEILENKDKNEQEKMLERINLEIKRLDKLLERILQLNKMSFCREGIDKSEIDLQKIVEKICEDASFEGKARNIQVSCSLAGLPPIKANKELISRAIENVLRNALKYAFKDTLIEIKTEFDQTAEMVKIVISDSGPGIEAGHLARVLEPFYRCQNDRDRKTGGAGLGLAIAARAVAAHNGEINLVNRPEGGLTVFILLPLNPNK